MPSGRVALLKKLVFSSIVLGVAAPAAAQTAASPNPKGPQTQAQRAPAAQRPLSRSIFLANIDAEFRKIDADKNGSVTRAEVEAFQRAVSVLQIGARNRALFARLDRDRDGQLSAAEFAAFNSAPPKPNSAPFVGRYDLNRDQSITLVEYRTGTLANFDRMDADKDGVVRPEEMRAASVRTAGR